MYGSIRGWLQKYGELLLKDVGIQSGHFVLDFGCGKGLYSIPAAEVVGKTGRVFALDQKRSLLDQLTDEASLMGLTNITAVHTLRELYLSLKNRLLDAVLLYDVIHSYYFTVNERRSLLCSISTKVKVEGFVSVFPKHMEPSEIEGLKKEMQSLGFFLERELWASLIHDGSYETGCILNFHKK